MAVSIAVKHDVAVCKPRLDNCIGKETSQSELSDSSGKSMVLIDKIHTR